MHGESIFFCTKISVLCLWKFIHDRTFGFQRNFQPICKTSMKLFDSPVVFQKPSTATFTNYVIKHQEVTPCVLINQPFLFLNQPVHEWESERHFFVIFLVIFLHFFGPEISYDSSHDVINGGAKLRFFARKLRKPKKSDKFLQKSVLISDIFKTIGTSNVRGKKTRPSF